MSKWRNKSPKPRNDKENPVNDKENPSLTAKALADSIISGYCRVWISLLSREEGQLQYIPRCEGSASDLYLF